MARTLRIIQFPSSTMDRQVLFSLSVLFAGSPALHWALTQGSAWDTLGKRKERPKWPFPDMGSVKHLHGIEGTGKNHSSPTPAAAGTEKEGDIFQPPYDKGSLLLGRSTHHPVPNWVGKRK